MRLCDRCYNKGELERVTLSSDCDESVLDDIRVDLCISCLKILEGAIKEFLRKGLPNSINEIRPFLTREQKDAVMVWHTRGGGK